MLAESISLIEWLGIGGFILGVVNLWLLLSKHLKDKPIVEIKKNMYKKYKKFSDINPKEYAERLSRGDFNDGSLNYEIRELVVDITNNGFRNARLKKVLPLYEQGKSLFFPKVINFSATTIESGDREEVHLFFEFQKEKIKQIEKTLPNVIWVTFDFAHKKIRKKFVIGKHSIKS